MSNETDEDDVLKVPSTYPPFLAKACEDPFFYAIGLVCGAVIFFEHAAPLDEVWVRLVGVEDGPNALRRYDGRQATFDRGIDVRVDQIAWVADAPYGS